MNMSVEGLPSFSESMLITRLQEMSVYSFIIEGLKAEVANSHCCSIVPVNTSGQQFTMLPHSAASHCKCPTA